MSTIITLYTNTHAKPGGTRTQLTCNENTEQTEIQVRQFQFVGRY